ncbi:helix-turn-helix domain-containing protein [Gordonia sp. LUNF6]|uniref:helix-turn-helix domain-containing protein n=1 Tax=Gordonia sp. LUNF6 TaxID=3388658 RepID=UPI00399A88BF
MADSPEPAAPILLGAATAAAALGVHHQTLRALARSGEIPVVRVGRRVLFRRDDLERWAAAAATAL